MSSEVDIDGFPIRNLSDLLRWQEESEARLIAQRDRFREVLQRSGTPDHGGVTREQLLAAHVAYDKAMEERTREHALLKRVISALQALYISEDETLGQVMERIGPEAQTALVIALFGDDEGEAPLSFPTSADLDRAEAEGRVLHTEIGDLITEEPVIWPDAPDDEKILTLTRDGTHPQGFPCYRDEYNRRWVLHQGNSGDVCASCGAHLAHTDLLWGEDGEVRCLKCAPIPDDGKA
jgi:hypothetical protein